MLSIHAHPQFTTKTLSRVLDYSGTSLSGGTALSKSEEFRSVDPPTYTVPQFCDAHNISRAFFYQLLKNDSGPQVLKLGRRTLISGEAAAEWRRRLQATSLLAS